MKRDLLRFAPLWLLGAAVVVLGLALWSRWGADAWVEQVIAWCM